MGKPQLKLTRNQHGFAIARGGRSQRSRHGRASLDTNAFQQVGLGLIRLNKKNRDLGCSGVAVIRLLRETQTSFPGTALQAQESL